jgi:hypothetical protein
MCGFPCVKQIFLIWSNGGSKGSNYKILNTILNSRQKNILLGVGVYEYKQENYIEELTK